MKKTICLLVSTVLMTAVSCFADDVPTGFSPLSEIKEVQAKAALEGKLVLLVVKGDAESANVEAAFHTGMNSVGGGVEKIFTRTDEINNANRSAFPKGLKELMDKRLFTTGYSVTFVVFDPKMTTIYAQASGRALLNDRKLNIDFKKKVQDAKKTLK